MALSTLSTTLLFVLLPGLALAPPSEEDAPSPGASDLGDLYFPGSGNGGYDVQHYALDLKVDMNTDDLEAVAVIDARSTQALSSFNFDLIGFEVGSVSVDTVPAEFRREGMELIITPKTPVAKGKAFRTRIEYSGVPAVAPDSSVASMGLKGTGWMRRKTGVFVMSECVGAPGWFPCNDHPLDKATFSIRVTVDKPYVVAANGILADEVENGASRTYVWRANDPMATYLATVNIAEFELELDEGGHDVFLRLYFPKGTPKSELEAFARTGEMIEYFAELFGDYPFESFGAVLSAEQLGGALESQTLPVYSRGVGEGTVAHELAHQWFGNCVSVNAWEHLWLSEGFAVYAEMLWSEHLEGREALEARARRAYQSAKRRGTGPPADPGVGRVFSSSTYVRGSLVLHALRLEVGDELFFKILKTWVGRYFNSTASSSDFIAIAEEVASRPLDELFDAWLYGETVPDAPHFEEPKKAR